jgi:predicted MFS family arabinose efflux permease
LPADQHPCGADGAPLPLGLLAAAGFLSSAGARIVDPLLAPIAHDFHSNVPAVSIILAAFVLPYGINQILLGPVGDRYGKLKVLLGALSGYSLFNLACAFAGNLPTLTVLRACAGASSAGLIPVCLAYIGDSVPYGLRQVTLSRFLTGVVLAQSLAGPVAGVFSDSLGWRGVFGLLAAGGATLAVLLAGRLSKLPDRTDPAAGFTWCRYTALLQNPYARVLLLLTVAEGIVIPGFFPFIAPYLNRGFGLSYARVGLVLACFGLGAYGYTRGASGLIARLGETGQVLLGGLLIAGAVAAGTASGRWEAFVFVQIAIGFGYFALHTVMQTRATELLPEARSTAVSSFVFALFLGQALGALLIGPAIGVWGYRGTFLVNAGLIAALTVLLALVIAQWSHQHAAGGEGSLANRSRHAP